MEHLVVCLPNDVAAAVHIARRDISRGVTPVGRDLIAARLAVAIRVAGRLCPQDLLVGNAVGCLPAFSDRSQQFSVVLLCCSACSLFAWCLALERLSRLEVVSVSWDPHPWEPVEGAMSRPCAGVEAGARLASRARGLRTCAFGGSRFGVLSVPWPRSLVLSCDGTGVCSFPTWRCAEHCFRFVPDSVGFCGSRVGATTLFLLLWPVRDW
ncbi:hypothetical protein Taro_021229 [Colocasia esculenta]|uniref:Uncharacterized protein n=1 Tax=Colocasia esculenta TaxID=4460 RepID=A0A843V7K9_COLES|nr:hypothetical protein [Colocasia esculenta]